MAITTPGPPGIGGAPIRIAIGAEHARQAELTPASIGVPTTAAGRAVADDVIRDLVTAQELERRRIARELHDVVGQALTAVKLNLQTLRRHSDDSPADAVLSLSIALVDEAMRDVRDFAFDLRPAILDDLGLVAAASWYVSRQARIVGYESRFQADQIKRAVGVEIEAACFRTLQEALTNVARHAQARHVSVELLQAADALILVVEDDGVGFDVPRAWKRAGLHPTLGLLGISERVGLVGGTLEVVSRPGRGTTIRVRFPRRRARPAMGERR